MGLLFVQRLDGNGVFKCRRCRVDAASKDAIISKEFQGSSGRAYLFDHVVNICLGPNEDRYLITGLHTVNDIYCSCCQQILGWRYHVLPQEKAYDQSQKYKEGKFILERARMWKDS
uniref:Protein yippee-like n=1 Tax=Oryza meridionalis TaxID=40149 RepID=A0A0E0CWJ9_9ORYZ